MKARLNLTGCIMSGDEPTASYVYKDGVRTSEIDGYNHKVLDMQVAEVFKVKVKKECKIKPMQKVKVINPIGNFYSFDGNSGLSIVADDIEVMN